MRGGSATEGSAAGRDASPDMMREVGRQSMNLGKRKTEADEEDSKKKK
jgi:hypothetical protein